jgi:hypothetical protein
LIDLTNLITFRVARGKVEVIMNRNLALACALSAAAITNEARAVPKTTSFADAKFTSATDSGNTCNYKCSDSQYVLGTDTVSIVGTNPNTAGPATEFYLAGPLSIKAEKTHKGTYGLASSAMTTAGPDAFCEYPYMLETKALVNLDGLGGFFFGPAGTAHSIATDPQVFAFPFGTSAINYGLASGSALYAARSGMDSAHIGMAIDVPFIAGYLATVDVSNSGSGVIAHVAFSGGSGVSYYNPATHAPITSAAVEAALMSHPDFATVSGLTSPLSLFGIAIDLAGRPAPGDGIGVNTIADAGSAAGLPLPDGDFNFDGTVDAADYVTWRMSDGTPDDYDAWRANFGVTVGSGSMANSLGQAVPEPAVFTMVVAGAVVGLLRRQRSPLPRA